MNSLHQVPTEQVNIYTVITLPWYIAPKKFAVLHLVRALFKLMDRCEFKVTKYNIVCVIQEHCQLIQNTPQKRNEVYRITTERLVNSREQATVFRLHRPCKENDTTQVLYIHKPPCDKTSIKNNVQNHKDIGILSVFEKRGKC